MKLQVTGIPTAFVDELRAGGPDRHGGIVHETGAVVAGQVLESACRDILARDGVACVHVRSTFNGFQCRVDRA